MKGIHRDIKTAREIIKEKRTGGLDVDVSIDHDMVVNPGKYVDLLVKAPENGVKAAQNVGNAVSDIKDRYKDWNWYDQEIDGIIRKMRGFKPK